jgi:hypothetical protein
MLELIFAAAFFTTLVIVTAFRALRPRTVRAEVSPMRATLERRVREGGEFRL